MADFQDHFEDFKHHDTRLLAASVDPYEDAVKTASSLKLTYPVAFGLNAEEISRVSGAFYKEEKRFLHATGFLLNRSGTVIVAVYSTGAIGRLTATDSLKLIKQLQKEEKQNS